MASGADGAADALTRRYAKLSPAGPPGKYRVTFTGINSGADYVRLSALLQGMSVVRGNTPLRATPQGLEVELEMLTGLPGFRRDRKSTRLNSSNYCAPGMPFSA